MQAGGEIVNQYKDFGLVYAKLPVLSIEKLRRNIDIDFVEEDGKFAISNTDQIGNHSSKSQTMISSVIANYDTNSWWLKDVGVKAVHDANDTGLGIKIAILDTGIDYKHPDLAPNYKGGYNFISNNNDPMDDNGHGTHVAGIIAAAGTNGFHAISGVAPRASIYAVKVSDSNGKGSFDTLIEGINWAITHKMNIITMSITSEDGSLALQKAIDVAYNNYGIILVSAVGNGYDYGYDTAGLHEILYPAGYPQVIGVGSVDSNNNRSPFSLTGSNVELVAPGSQIVSTWIGGGYEVLSGTSMATPFVTGAIALLLDTNETSWKKDGYTNGDGKWTNYEIRNLLDKTAKHLGETSGRNREFGYGLLNTESFASHVLHKK
jgi:subtilisin family serine protease